MRCACRACFNKRLTIPVNKLSMDRILDAIKGVQGLVEDEKENLNNGEYLRLCNAMQRVYNCANSIKTGESPNEDEEEEEHLDMSEEDEDEDEDEESGSESGERTEDDMDLNELSDLWGWHFNSGHPNAVMPLDGLILEIVEDDDPRRVCAAVRVLNRALVGSKPDDPADAEKILQWKEELVAERAIRVCAEILEKIDIRGFHNENHDEHWLYSILCCEIVQLFECLAEDDALFRTKMRRNGALKGMEEYAKDHLQSECPQSLLCELRQRR